MSVIDLAAYRDAKQLLLDLRENKPRMRELQEDPSVALSGAAVEVLASAILPDGLNEVLNELTDDEVGVMMACASIFYLYGYVKGESNARQSDAAGA